VQQLDNNIDCLNHLLLSEDEISAIDNILKRQV
jgi:aryl-alcohol dehydrogenase-like predicted oxidoreductase